MNKHGLYSKAAKLIRALPQERGTADQMIAAARLKDTPEMRNFGAIPAGKISREDLAQLFETRLPQVTINQYGENPNYLSREEARELRALEQNPQDIPLMPFEQNRMAELRARRSGAMPIGVEMREDEEENEEPEDTRYEGYNLPGGQNYRERLLRLTQYDHPVKNMDRTIKSKERQLEYETPIYGADHPIIQQSRQRLEEMRAERERAAMLHGEPWTDKEKYHSSHWDSHPNVIAHIRMQDRQVGEDKATIQSILQRLATMAGVDDVRHLGSGAVHVGLQNGVITPQEAASVSRAKGWYTGHENKPGIGKRLLHVEELQSDWGQEGRDKGFNDGSAVKAYRDHVEDMRSRMRQSLLDKGLPENVARPLYESAEPWHLAKFHGEEEKLNSLRDAVNNQQGKVPTGPYVTNTQHWTDLALKNVLREAALGNYDGIVFTPGKAQANRYGLEKQLDALHYEPETQSLYGEQNGKKVVEKSGVKPEELGSYVGKDAAEKLMNPENHYQYGNTIRSTLTGGDLKMGGRGMVKYYDEMVPKSVLKLAKMHDPDIKPAEPVGLSDNEEDYQGFHLPMTQKLRQGILNEGFPAMRRGGAVGYEDGGSVTPDIQNPMSIFPKPQRMFPEDQRPAGGQYLSMPSKTDVTGHKAEAATIGVAPGGKPFFRASQNAVDQTGSTGRGTATAKTNLFKQKAGWRWAQAPEGHEATDTIVSVEHRGKHYYTLNAHFPKGVDLARYENAPSEPRLRPTTRGNVETGPQAGSILVRGREHPVYHHVIVKADGGSVDAALAATRRFTKDGQHVTMRLKD